jgi:toxin ParE1/3/4
LARTTKLSPQALADLEDIWDFIAQDDPEAADRFVESLYETCSVIFSMPRVGRTRFELARGLRSFPHGAYVIFYVLDGETLTIARVLHGSRDLPKNFQ